jgi:hypothetical protein
MGFAQDDTLTWINTDGVPGTQTHPGRGVPQAFACDRGRHTYSPAGRLLTFGLSL